ncbi:hypothetical protein H4R22_000422 [Coemansia sp. RSA 1290]|nr:hypothetical protein H4R22_000422 [Coemansia sp. RSA 1290]KAJ2650836.1 hypothetical protein IWW40_002098 [Coemansia sp. RSA 1250]
MPSNYIREHQSYYESGGAGAQPYPVHVYKHKDTEFRVVVCQMPGPLCHMAVCVPTVCTDHKGKPHTLEHMVFCGSERFPYLGYIDAVAAHNLGQPMNASTYPDMTMYKFAGLGQEGAANMLPIVLDHVMHPLIQDNHFATEVYHVDQDGRQQGVILSEMSDFAYKEGSVRLHSLRQMLYSLSSTYAWEAGGLPQSIETLTTNDVAEYHREFYNYSNLTLLLVGAFDECPQAIFDVLNGINDEITASPPALKRPMPQMRTKREKRRNDVAFASEKVDMGTMAFAWEGPQMEDVETHIALEMLIEFLTSDSTSPLRRRFTNRPVPIAGDIHLAISDFFPAMIDLCFTEVPLTSYMSHAAAAAEAATATSRHHDAAIAASYPSPADAFGPIDLTKLHDDVSKLFASNYYRKQLVSTLTYMVDHWLHENWTYFNSFLAKRVAALAASFPQKATSDRERYCVLRMLARDAVAYRLSPGSVDLPCPNFASRGRHFSIRNELLKRDCTFWIALVQKWFLDNQMVHVAMIPDPKLGIQIEAERNLNQRSRIESMTPEELERARVRAAEALELTKARVPVEALAALPPVPDISKVHTPEFKGYNLRLDSSAALQSPFGLGRVLVIPGEASSQFQVSIPISTLPGELRAYLPLFVNLVKSSSGLLIPSAVVDLVKQNACLPIVKPAGMPFAYLPSDQIDSAISNVLIDYNICIGNCASSGSTGLWPNEVLTLYGSTKSSNLLQGFTLIVLKLLFGDFGEDAILKTASTHEKKLRRVKGTPTSLLIDTFPWLRIPGPLDAHAIANLQVTTDARSSYPADEPLGRAINVYFQLAFLSSVSKSLSLALNGDSTAVAGAHRVGSAISQIRSYAANCIENSGLVHVALPKLSNPDEPLHVFDSIVGIWRTCSQAWCDSIQMVSIPESPCQSIVEYNVKNSPHPSKRRRTETKDTEVVLAALKARPGSSKYVTLDAPLGIHLALSSLQTSYAGIQIPLVKPDLNDTAAYSSFEERLQHLPERDKYALILLSHVLNRSGGMVKNAIRGRGYAYGVGIHTSYSDGHLAVYISHAVDPIKAMEAFWETIATLQNEDQWNENIDEFQLNAARSIYFLRFYTDINDSLAFEDASSMFSGYTGLDQNLLWVRKHVEAITLADLRRVFIQHYTPFIQKSTSSALYLVATPQSAVEPGVDFAARLSKNPYGINFRTLDMSALEPVVHI